MKYIHWPVILFPVIIQRNFPVNHGKNDHAPNLVITSRDRILIKISFFFIVIMTQWNFRVTNRSSPPPTFLGECAIWMVQIVQNQKLFVTWWSLNEKRELNLDHKNWPGNVRIHPNCQLEPYQVQVFFFIRNRSIRNRG